MLPAAPGSPVLPHGTTLGGSFLARLDHHPPGNMRPPGRGYGYRPRAAAAHASECLVGPQTSPRVSTDTAATPAINANARDSASTAGLPPPSIGAPRVQPDVEGGAGLRNPRRRHAIVAAAGLLLAAIAFTAFVYRERADQTMQVPVLNADPLQTSSPATADIAAGPSTRVTPPQPEQPPATGVIGTTTDVIAPSETSSVGAAEATVREVGPVSSDTGRPANGVAAEENRSDSRPIGARQPEDRAAGAAPTLPVRPPSRASAGPDPVAGPAAVTASRSDVAPPGATATMRSPAARARSVARPEQTRPARAELCPVTIVALGLCKANSAD
jgi:hypothetical protein